MHNFKAVDHKKTFYKVMTYCHDCFALRESFQTKYDVIAKNYISIVFFSFDRRL